MRLVDDSSIISRVNATEGYSLLQLPHGVKGYMGERIWQFFLSIHIILSVGVYLTNLLSLWVTFRIVQKLTTPLQILSNLAILDLMVPWTILIMYMPYSDCQWEIQSGLQLTVFNIYSTTLLFLASTHLIATYWPFKFTTWMTRKRLWVTINLFWLLCILIGHLNYFFALLSPDYQLTFCEDVFQHTWISTITSLVICCVTIVTNIVLYVVILFSLLKADENTPGNTPPKSLRGVVTGLILLVAMIVSWLPFLILKHVETSTGGIQSEGLIIGQAVTMTIILLVSFLNPVLYALRMVNVSVGYSILFRQFKNGAINVWGRCRNMDNSDQRVSTPLEPIESIC